MDNFVYFELFRKQDNNYKNYESKLKWEQANKYFKQSSVTSNNIIRKAY